MQPPTTGDFERLGVFYLGREYDLDAQERRDSLVLYDSRDLVTHAVCVGMTGSGKTGLCIGLLEEAAIDGVPAIVIDPKGDLTNLLLTFPELRPEDFRPWVNEEDAKRAGVSPEEFAVQQAARWRKGLAEWGQDGARISRLRAAADFVVYTPGSNAGRPVSVLRSFDPPANDAASDPEVFAERVATTATSLLGLAGIEADPAVSREHILISNILSESWKVGRGLDLAAIIHQVQTPPTTRIGVMDVETFYPAKDRFGLAMALNRVLASPGFSRWLEGEPLDIASMLRTATGRPRHAVFSISHLNDSERMFFVSLLLNHASGWARAQSGTSSLRAIVYMDEIAGYCPPTANPPSKAPLLTLMKQGRAFGVGVVVATQNPVDLDYKALSNAGTWFIGRLQTERDKARVLDGLEGASAGAGGGFDRAEMDRTLSRLGSRIFVLHSVHEDHPVVFETRWVMSYLRGPLTREQVRMLNPADADGSSVGERPASTAVAAATASNARPAIQPGVPQYFLRGRSLGSMIYRPMLIGFARAGFSDAKLGVDCDEQITRLTPFSDGPLPIDWDKGEECSLSLDDLESEPPAQSAADTMYEPLPAAAAKKDSYDDWGRQLSDWVFRTAKLELRRSSSLKIVSLSGESERDFRARLAHAARERRDEAVEKLRAKYGPKLATLEDRIRRAQQTVEVQKSQATAAKMSTALSFGTTLLSALMGRKVVSSGNISRAASAARGVGRSAKETGDVARAEENVDALRGQAEELQGTMQAEIAELESRVGDAAADVEVTSLRPKKSAIEVRAVALVWAPHIDGKPAW